jgi:hypothetical protein
VFDIADYYFYLRSSSFLPNPYLYKYLTISFLRTHKYLTGSS